MPSELFRGLPRLREVGVVGRKLAVPVAFIGRYAAPLHLGGRRAEMYLRPALYALGFQRPRVDALAAPMTFQFGVSELRPKLADSGHFARR